MNLTRTILGAWECNSYTLREARDAPQATRQAYLIVGIAALIAGLTSALYFAPQAERLTYPAAFIIIFAFGIIRSIVHWGVWLLVVHYLGKSFMPGSRFTRPQSVRVLGLAYAPQWMRIFAILPDPIGPFFMLLPTIWQALAASVGIRALAQVRNDIDLIYECPLCHRPWPSSAAHVPRGASIRNDNPPRVGVIALTILAFLLASFAASKIFSIGANLAGIGG